MEHPNQHGRSTICCARRCCRRWIDNGWQFLAVTSATAGCGKSVTACNLAMSIARLAERSVLLVDMDMQKPKVAEYLGLEAGKAF